MWASAGFAVAVGFWGYAAEHSGLGLILLAYPAALLAAALSTRGTASPGVDRDRRDARARPAEPLWPLPPHLLVLLAGVLVFGVAMATAFTVLPLRIVDVGGAVAVVGVSSVVGAAAEIPLMHRSAWLASRYGPRVIVLLGGGLFTLALVLYAVVSDPWGLVAASAVRGAGYALVYVGFVVRVRRSLPPSLQARGQGLLQTALMGVAPVVGASLGGLGYSHLAPAVLFGLAAAVALIGAALAAGRHEPDALLPAGERLTAVDGRA
jgi:predicted MFS family arabinose efflux permease